MSEANITYSEPHREGPDTIIDAYALGKELALYLAKAGAPDSDTDAWDVYVVRTDGCCECVSICAYPLAGAKSLLEETFLARLHAGWPTLMSEVKPEP